MNPMPSSNRALLAAALLLVVPLAAQKPDEPPPPEWPKVSAEDAQRIQGLLRLLTNDKPEAREEAQAALAEIGAAAAPALMRRISDHDPDGNVPVVAMLDRITTPEHAPLLAKEATSRKKALRTWVLRRLTGFRLPAMKPVFEAALHDHDPDIALQAQLGLLSAGEMSSFDAVFDHCTKSWSELGDRVTAALPGIKGKDATTRILKRMSNGDEQVVVTGLRFLRLVGDRDVATAIAPRLDDESSLVKKETINTLRVLVDGAPPLDELSVFEAVERVKKWKERLQ